MVKIPPVKLPDAEALAIYNPKLDKWSRGGTGPHWGKKPKIWSQVGPFKNHLSMFVDRYYAGRWLSYDAVLISDAYDGCVIVDVKTGKAHATLKLEELLMERAQRLQSEWKRTTPPPILKLDWSKKYGR